jgi:aspartyl-tRNA(Asn)/glutamyl-tRNA(Gln) amidotransferase subunit A
MEEIPGKISISVSNRIHSGRFKNATMRTEIDTVLSLAEKIRSGSLSAETAFSEFKNRIAANDGEIQAFNLVSDSLPAFVAEQPLAGVPIGTKDVFCEKGVPTTASSNMLANFVPPYESTVTARLKAAGAVSMGKLNMDEYAMGGS